MSSGRPVGAQRRSAVRRASRKPPSRTRTKGSSKTLMVEVLGRYSNPDIVACLTRILSGQGRDRVSHRPVPSLPPETDAIDRFATIRPLARYQGADSSNALADGVREIVAPRRASFG